MKTGRTECSSGNFIVKTNPLTPQTEVRIPPKHTSRIIFFTRRARRIFFVYGRILPTDRRRRQYDRTLHVERRLDFIFRRHKTTTHKTDGFPPTTLSCFFLATPSIHIDNRYAAPTIFFCPTGVISLRDRIFFLVHSVQTSIEGVPRRPHPESLFLQLLQGFLGTTATHDHRVFWANFYRAFSLDHGQIITGFFFEFSFFYYFFGTLRQQTISFRLRYRRQPSYS